MTKTKENLSTLGSNTLRLNLRLVHPFLYKEFRIILKSELKSAEVFKELFGEKENVDLAKLDAIYKFQQCDTKTRTT